MIKILKNESALTIIEVLVAVILTAIVMLHGTVFFIATWRLNAESKDYNLVLNDVVANLEKCISRSRNANVSNDDYVIKTRKLRNKYDVTYTLVKTRMMDIGMLLPCRNGDMVEMMMVVIIILI